MKKTFLTLIFVFTTAILFAQREEYKREITKDFSVNANAYLLITNMYGNVNIIEGNESKIAFKIEITGKGKNAETAKEYADGVDVDFTSSNNRISAKTQIPNMKCNNCGISVDYVVVVPRSTTMDFNIKYGKLAIKDTPKPLTVYMMYGDITANNIVDAVIDIKYGDVKLNECAKLQIKSMYGKFKSEIVGDAVVDTKYGKFEFGTGKNLKLTSRYSDVAGNSLTNASIDIQYGKTKIEKCDNLDIVSHYGNVKITTVSKDVKIKIHYDNVEIGKCDHLDIVSFYGDVKVTTVSKDAKINIQYADVEIGKCNNLVSSSMYTNFKINEILSIKTDKSSYDDFHINTISDFTISSLYTDVTIGKLNNSFAASKFTYGKLTVTNINMDFSKITVDNGLYLTIKLGLTEQHNFKANLSAGDNGDIRAGNIKFNGVTVLKAKNAIVGTAGKSDNPKAEVTISASYGDIIFQ